MLARSHRTTSTDIRSLKESGKTIHSPHLLLSYTTNTPHRESRFGCVVSKKVSKRAPERNVLKRRMREALRLFVHTPVPIIALLHAKKGANDLSFSQLQEEIQTLLKKVA